MIDRALPITIWTFSSHFAPVRDIARILKDFNVRLIVKTIPKLCNEEISWCEDDLEVVTDENFINLQPCPTALRHQFFMRYRNDPQIRATDAFLCTHVASFCELFMAFDKPIIVYATTRYEFGRHDPIRWMEWNDNIRRIASKSYNSIIANNAYDVEYLKYFTGIDDVLLIPSLCEYASVRHRYRGKEGNNTNFHHHPFNGSYQQKEQQDAEEVERHEIEGKFEKMTWNPIRREVLIAPVRGHRSVSVLLNELRQLAETKGIEVAHIRQLYPHYEFEDLAQHVAVVLIPHQVSFMLLFELYQLGIPIFAPSPTLLVQWHLELDIMKERSWINMLYPQYSPERRSGVPRDQNSSSSQQSDPNDDATRCSSSLSDWVHLSDLYQLPHITVFESWEDLLVNKLVKVDVINITRSMHGFNVLQGARVRQLWKQVLQRVESHPSFQHRKRLFVINDTTGNDVATTAGMINAAATNIDTDAASSVSINTTTSSIDTDAASSVNTDVASNVSINAITSSSIGVHATASSMDDEILSPSVGDETHMQCTLNEGYVCADRSTGALDDSSNLDIDISTGALDNLDISTGALDHSSSGGSGSSSNSMITSSGKSDEGDARESSSFALFRENMIRVYGYDIDTSYYC